MRRRRRRRRRHPQGAASVPLLVRDDDDRVGRLLPMCRFAVDELDWIALNAAGSIGEERIGYAL
jgi:hypothetical protein